ncbi:MAG TPA: TerB family tellurite resistance protein [Kofleriaceae bacterium]|nr:TerB family tellurite resistance protein [Kofleriaceae bacterium]
MTDLFPEVEVNDAQAEAIARGLFAVAKADGNLHERERTLISEFFASISERPSDLAALDREAAIAPATLALALARGPVRQLFLMTALLLALCDGQYGPGEAALIKSFAAALEVDDAQLTELTTRVKEHMLGQLSHLQNTDATVAVARELEV